jgi:hypothetical protein
MTAGTGRTIPARCIGRLPAKISLSATSAPLLVSEAKADMLKIGTAVVEKHRVALLARQHFAYRFQYCQKL